MLNFNIRSSFTTRLIVGSLIALFLLSIPVAITAHWILRNNTINQAGANALAQTEQIAQSVDRHLKEHLRDLVYTSRIEQSFGNYTAEEQTIRDAKVKEWNDASGDRKLIQIKKMRLEKLQETDWMAMSDLTMSDAWKAKRQAWRDIPQNNSTETEYDALLARDSNGNLTNTIWNDA